METSRLPPSPHLRHGAAARSLGCFAASAAFSAASPALTRWRGLKRFKGLKGVKRLKGLTGGEEHNKLEVGRLGGIRGRLEGPVLIPHKSWWMPIPV